MKTSYKQLYSIKDTISPLVQCRINSCYQSWWLPQTPLWSLHVSEYPLYTQIIRFTFPSYWFLDSPNPDNLSFLSLLLWLLFLFQFNFCHDWPICFPSLKIETTWFIHLFFYSSELFLFRFCFWALYFMVTFDPFMVFTCVWIPTIHPNHKIHMSFYNLPRTI